MEGLTVFNEIFDKDPPEPMDKTERDGRFHVNALNANKGVDPVILKMHTDTNPKFETFITDKTLYDKNAGDFKIMNSEFDTLVDGLNDIFRGYQRKIVILFPPETSAYKALFWESITDMFEGGIAKKIANVNRFILTLDDYPSILLIKADLILEKAKIITKQQDKADLDSLTTQSLTTARASQKIFCIEEQGNTGGLMQFYKETPFVCNQYFEVTDIKHYQETELAKAKKAALIHEFEPNTITIVPGVVLTPSCKPNIKCLSVEGAKLGSTFEYGSEGKAIYYLASGKTFKKNIKIIGAINNPYLVVDTTGNTGIVKLRIEIK